MKFFYETYSNINESGVFFQTSIKGLTKTGKEIISIKSINLNKPSSVKAFIFYCEWLATKFKHKRFMY